MSITTYDEELRAFPPEDWERRALPAVLTEITSTIIGVRRHRTCPRAVKRARHNSYRVKKPDEPSSTRHTEPPTVRIHKLQPRAA
jgi:hypothetical protein